MVEIRWGTSPTFDMASAIIPRRPVMIVAPNRYRWHLPMSNVLDSGGHVDDFYLDVQLQPNPSPFGAQSLVDGTFPTGSVMTLYGVS